MFVRESFDFVPVSSEEEIEASKTPYQNSLLSKKRSILAAINGDSDILITTSFGNG